MPGTFVARVTAEGLLCLFLQGTDIFDRPALCNTSQCFLIIKKSNKIKSLVIFYTKIPVDDILTILQKCLHACNNIISGKMEGLKLWQGCEMIF